jgi:DNA-binding transcriptional ArsR family regulator
MWLVDLACRSGLSLRGTLQSSILCKVKAEHATEPALRHPLRVALLDLVAELGSVTSTEAARRLGESSGSCSFHLRQLARYGYLEPAPAGRGRSRPWQRPSPRSTPAAQSEPGVGPALGAGLSNADLGPLARDLEDEGYRRWLHTRADAPAQWQRDEAFSAVLYLTPDELTELAGRLRHVLAPYEDREYRPDRRPAEAAPVGVIARLFPLLPGPGTD